MSSKKTLSKCASSELLLATGGRDIPLSMWRGGTTLLWKHPARRADELRFSPDGRQLAVLSWEDDLVDLFESESGKPITTLPARQCCDVRFSPNGQHIAVMVQDDIVVVETHGWQPLARLRGHVTTARCLAWSPDGRRLASGSHDRTIRGDDTSTWQLRYDTQSHRGEVLSLLFSPDSRSLVSVSRNGRISV
jgi:eukaryotic-like serine/threonine-protein kinase